MQSLVFCHLDIINNLHSVVGKNKFIFTEMLLEDLNITRKEALSMGKKYTYEGIFQKCGRIRLPKNRMYTKYRLTDSAINSMYKFNENIKEQIN